MMLLPEVSLLDWSERFCHNHNYWFYNKLSVLYCRTWHLDIISERLSVFFFISSFDIYELTECPTVRLWYIPQKSKYMQLPVSCLYNSSFKASIWFWSCWYRFPAGVLQKVWMWLGEQSRSWLHKIGRDRWQTDNRLLYSYHQLCWQTLTTCVFPWLILHYTPICLE